MDHVSHVLSTIHNRSHVDHPPGKLCVPILSLDCILPIKITSNHVLPVCYVINLSDKMQLPEHVAVAQTGLRQF